MKRERNFYYFLFMIMYIMCFTTSLILTCRVVKIGNLTPNAAFIIYPLTYFLLVLFAERYSKREAKLLLHYSVFALLIMSLFMTIASLLPVLSGFDGLEPILNMDYRIIFSFIAAFYISQYLNLEIYYFMNLFKGFNFLISSVIAATIDSLVFILLAYLGSIPFDLLIQNFTSQYVVNVFMVIAYTLLFTYTIDSVIEANHKEIDKEIKKEEVKKVVVRKPKTETKKVVKPVKKETTTKAKPKTTVKKQTKKETK